MRLRYFASAMTEMVVGAAVAAGMWIWTQADILEILFMVLLLAPLAGLGVLTATEPDRQKSGDTVLNPFRNQGEAKRHERKTA